MQDVYLNKNDLVALVPTSVGVVVVVGPISDEDERVVEEIIRRARLLGSAVTCHRFLRRQLDADFVVSEPISNGCDKSQPAKALTGQRTPKS